MRPWWNGLTHKRRLLVGQLAFWLLICIPLLIVSLNIGATFVPKLITVKNLPLFNLYATNGETRNAIYLTPPGEENKKMLLKMLELYEQKKNAFGDTNFSVMLRNKADVEALLADVPEYTDYLAAHGKTLADFWAYIEKIADLVYILPATLMALFFLGCFSLIYLVDNEGTCIFLPAVIIYLVLSLFTFSGQLLGYGLFDLLGLDPGKYRLWMDCVFVPFREAAMVFIIVDSLYKASIRKPQEQCRELWLSLTQARRALAALPAGTQGCRLCFDCCAVVQYAKYWHLWEHAQWRALKVAAQPLCVPRGGAAPTFCRETLLAHIDALLAAMQSLVALEGCAPALLVSSAAQQ